jgi:hypothetical protein
MKTPKEMTSDILSSLRDKDNPLGILIEGYLEECIKQHKKAVRMEIANGLANFVEEENGSSVIHDVKGLVEFINK